MSRILGPLRCTGRASRLSYWTISLLCILFVAGAWFVGLLLDDLIPTGLTFSDLGLVLGLVAAAAVGLAVTVRRLHDRGKSAWWLLIFVAIPTGARLVAEHLMDDGPNSRTIALGVLFIVVLPLSLWAFVDLGTIRGSPGPNRYGEDPLARTASDPTPVAVS